MDAIYEIEDVNQLAQKIQDIYAFSFDTALDKDLCKQIAIKATVLQSSCEM